MSILTEQQIDEVWQSLGGTDGFMKTFGYQQFARAIAMRLVFTSGDRTMTMKGRYFHADGGGISDENFDFDAGMTVSGDFVDDEKARYAKMIAEALNKIALQEAQDEQEKSND
jgi:hypothetical protein